MGQIVAVLVWLVLPLWVVASDLVAHFRAARRPGIPLEDDSPTCVRFEVLVPIYGDIGLLENIEFLSRYRERVVLCTTNGESDEFYDALTVLAWRYRFRVFHTDAGPRTATKGERAAAGPLRSKLIRDALHTVRAPYVVCLDADTLTAQPIEKLVGVVRAAGVDIASVRTVPANRDGLLARLQGHEYRMAARVRRLHPWLISRAAHVARTVVLREVMDRHSLFPQGDDAELGILAEAMDYDVGHVLVDVPTTVPSTLASWWRQRFAWAGGDFRTYVVNVRLGWRHRWSWLYGLVIVGLLTPLRWITLLLDPGTVAIVIGLYAVTLIAVNWRNRDWSLVLLPLYALFTLLVLVPLSVVAYTRLAIRHRNSGLIDPARWVAATPSVAPPKTTSSNGSSSNGSNGSNGSSPNGSNGSEPHPEPATSRCMSIAALGGRYSVPFHLGPEQLHVSLLRGEVRIARMVDGRPAIVARHTRVAEGEWSILDVHLAAEKPDDSSPTVDEIVDLWKQKIAPPPLPVRPKAVPDTGSR